MTANRLPYFPFNVADYLNDPAVMGMSADTEGIYVRLLARMWQSSTPGKVAEDLIYEMASLRRLSEQYRILWRRDEIPWEGGFEVAPEDLARFREEEVLEELARAFDTTSEPGTWIQKRMVTEWKRASELSAARVRGGRKAQKHRRSNAAPGNDIRTELKPTLSLDRGILEVEGEGYTEESEAARGRAPARRRSRKRAEPLTELTPADVARAAQLTGLPLATAEHLAERIRLEGPQRGYLNFPSALLNWCKREVERLPLANGHSASDRPSPRDGDRANSPTGPVVWWQGSWRSPGEARDFGWKP